MADQSGKILGWRSLFAGVIVSYVGAIVLNVIFIFTVPGYLLGAVQDERVACIDGTRVCVGSSIDSIESAMGYFGRRPSGIVEVFACDNGRKLIEGNVEAWLRSQCKNGEYDLKIKQRGHVYRIKFDMNVITEMYEINDVWSYLKKCLKYEGFACRKFE